MWAGQLSAALCQARESFTLGQEDPKRGTNRPQRSLRFFLTPNLAAGVLRRPDRFVMLKGSQRLPGEKQTDSKAQPGGRSSGVNE